MGVALTAVFTPECGGRVRSHKELTPEENMVNNSTFYTADLFGKGNAGREGIGTYFEQAQGPARDNAYKALQEYKKGNKEPLGTMIGKGLHFTANNIEHYDIGSDAYVSTNAAIAQTVSLLDQDPDLKVIARNAGMTDDDLNIARADLEAAKQYREDEWASERLEENARAREGAEDARTLSEDEKKFCIDAKLKYQTLNQAVKLFRAERESSEEYDLAVTEIMTERVPINMENANIGTAYNKGKITKEEYLKLRKDIQAKEEINNIKLKNAANKAIGVPKEMKALGAAAAKGKQGEVMNKLVNEILPNKDKLYGMESSKLSKELDINILYGKDSVYMAAPAANEAPKASVPVKEVQQAEKTAQSGPAPTVPMA